MTKILIVCGTRPEAIKLAPVYLNLRERGVDVSYLSTGQHDELHSQVTDFFDIEVLKDPSLAPKNRNLSDLCSDLIGMINKIIGNHNYTHVVVQGDTASAFCAAKVAFLNKLPVFHVEAGLRSGRNDEPFPEEAFRKMISIIADRHFCPTVGSRENLINEGIDAEKTYVTGNTAVDAVRLARQKTPNKTALMEELGRDLFNTLSSNSFILVTVHRRENHGYRLEQICDALISFSQQSNTHILCPVHPNPEIRIRLKEKLSFEDKVHLVPALSYPSMIWAINSCKFIVSDSGGLQEEAPSFQKRILILRNQTERPEVVTSGWGELIGTNASVIAEAMNNFDRNPPKNLPVSNNPFGNGFASDVISDVLLKL